MNGLCLHLTLCLPLSRSEGPATSIGTIQADTRPASFKERGMVLAEDKNGASIYHAFRVEMKSGIRADARLFWPSRRSGLGRPFGMVAPGRKDSGCW